MNCHLGFKIAVFVKLDFLKLKGLNTETFVTLQCVILVSKSRRLLLCSNVYLLLKSHCSSQ